MKCIIRQYKLSGGAPRSLLEHIKTLKSFGFDDITCMAIEGEKDIYSRYLDEGSHFIVRKSLSSLWVEKKYKALYEELKWEYKYIKNEAPDLVIVLGEIDGALYSRFCYQLGIQLIIYIAGGDLSSNEEVIDLWEHCEVICFSEENCDIIKKHFDLNHINVISNRINITMLFHDLQQKYKEPQSNINFLISSRLDLDKTLSIYSFLNMLQTCNLDKIRINIHIAGNGTQKAELEEYCNNIHNDNIHIKLLGHLEDLSDEFRWAHVIVGKGRSVIEPLMMNRIGCVIGDEKMQFCNTKTFDNLYHYNFSGRNIDNPNIQKDLEEVIKDIHSGSINVDEIQSVASRTRQYYSTDFLKEKVGLVLDKGLKSYPKEKHPHLLKQYLKMIIKKMQGKLK